MKETIAVFFNREGMILVLRDVDSSDYYDSGTLDSGRSKHAHTQCEALVHIMLI